jgi:hypothetical protein
MADPRQQAAPSQPASVGNEKENENEGEGSRTAARHYNEAQQRYVESGRVDQAAKEAERAIEGPEGDELRRAEEEGKRRAAGREP